MSQPLASISTHTVHKFCEGVMSLGRGNKSLRLDIGRQRLTFCNVTDFEFAVESRTDYPAEHFAQLIKLGPNELAHESRETRAVEQELVALIERSLAQPSSLTPSLSNIDLGVFSEDHQWHQIFRGLASKSRRYDEFKRIALTNYLKYLRARQNVIKSLHESCVLRESHDAKRLFSIRTRFPTPLIRQMF